MTMQIVVLAIYIIITATTSQGTEDILGKSDFDPLFLVMIMPPIVTALFLFWAHKINKARNNELPFKKILMFGLPGILGAVAFNVLNILPEYNLYILGAGLMASAVWPALNFRNKYRFSLDAEAATPQIMRDVAEARKAGLGPEKCVIRTCKRKDFGLFNPVANGVGNKLEWGMTLDDILKFIKKEVNDFQILINFKVLFALESAKWM